MQTKFNTGDPVLIPATIRSAKQSDAGIVYDMDVVAREVPEGLIQEDRNAIGPSMQAFAEAMPRRERW